MAEAETTEANTETTQAPEKGASDSQGTGKPAGDPGGAKSEDGKKPDAEGWWSPIPDEKAKAWAKRHPSPVEAAIEGFKLRQQLSNAVIPPGKDAKPEDVSAYRKKLGVPLNPEGYQFDMPEGHEATDFDKAFHTTIAKALHENNVPAPAAKALNKVYNDFVQEIQRQVSENDESAMQESETVLRRKWGSDYDANVQAGKKYLSDAAQATGNAQLVELANLVVDVGGKKVILGNVPLFAEVLAWGGRKLTEAGAQEVDPDALSQGMGELDKLYALNVSANPEDQRKYKSPPVQARIRELEDMRVKAKKRAA